MEFVYDCSLSVMFSGCLLALSMRVSSAYMARWQVLGGLWMTLVYGLNSVSDSGERCVTSADYFGFAVVRFCL